MQSTSSSDLASSSAPYLWNSFERDPAFTAKAVQYFVMGNLIWFFIFFVLGKYPPISAARMKGCSDYDRVVIGHRISCFYHGVVATLTGLYWHLYLFDITCSKKMTDFELLMNLNTVTHFIADLAYIWWHGFFDSGTLLHHTLGILSYSGVLYQQRNHNIIILNILPAELTNPFKNLREILKRVGLRYSKISYLNDYIFFVTYIPCRSIWIPAAAYFAYACDSMHPLVLLSYPLHIIRGLTWVYEMICLCGSRYRELQKFGANNVRLYWFASVDKKKIDELAIEGPRDPSRAKRSKA